MTSRAIFISAGLGDSLLTLPLARKLRTVSSRLVALLTSTLMTKSFLEKLELFDRVDVLSFKNAKKNWDWHLLPYVIRNFHRFDEIYLPPFSCNRAHRSLAALLAKRCCSHSNTDQLPVMHDAIQNMRLYDPLITSSEVSLSNVTFTPATVKRIVRGRLSQADRLSGPYVAVQISASDSMFPQKSWPFEHWVSWLEAVTDSYPTMNFVLIGGSREASVMNQMLSKKIPRVSTVNTSGSLENAAAILHDAHHFVGLDGGLMHLAACLGKPTFTLWGASNPTLYGYEVMDACRHRVVSLRMPCAPCESWLKPNHSRVHDARDCPDFRCIRMLSPATVIDEYFNYFQRLNAS